MFWAGAAVPLEYKESKLSTVKIQGYTNCKAKKAFHLSPTFYKHKEFSSFDPFKINWKSEQSTNNKQRAVHRDPVKVTCLLNKKDEASTATWIMGSP